MAELPELLTPSEIAELWRSPAKNRSRAGRDIIDRLGLPTVPGHRAGLVLVPRWAVLELIGAPTHCPTCGVPVGPEGCPVHLQQRSLAVAS